MLKSTTHAWENRKNKPITDNFLEQKRIILCDTLITTWSIANRELYNYLE